MPIPEALSTFAAHLKRRGAWALGAAAIGVVSSCASPAPPARTVEGVAAMLASAAGGDVRAEDFVWEERGGFWSDTFLGRRVLFLAKTGRGGRDLYRARVRLTRAGQPLAVAALKNLTRSPEGDDTELVAQGRHVGFATIAYGAVQGVTLLDFGGAREAPRTFGERFRAALDRWSTTGTTRGIARTEVVFEKAPPEVKIELEGDLLVMALGAEALPAALDARAQTLDTGDKNPFGARAHAIGSSPPSWSAFLVARSRDVFGPGAAGRVESAFASLADTLAKKGGPLPPPTGPVVPPASGFPPEKPEWHAPSAPDGLLPASGKDAPPYFAEASIDADGAAVRLVAIDTRRLDVGLAAGSDVPKTMTGVHGTGTLPRGVEARLVALFATGPADARIAADAETKPLGFVVERSPLTPPVPAAPSIAFAVDGSVRLGPWPGADAAALPPWLASLRQTPATLVGGAAEPPRPGDERALARSALCLLPSGQLGYAYARSVDLPRFSRALAAASCSFAVPLAAAPADVGFAYVRHREGAPLDAPDAFVSAPLADEMALGAEAIARGLRGDFAFVTLREAHPTPPLPSGAWDVDPAKQPSPLYLPAIFAATLTELGAQVHLTAFLPGRFNFNLRAGHRELANRVGGGWQTQLTDAEQARALAAIGVGNGRKKTPRGLATDGSVGLHFRADSGVLFAEAGAIGITKSDSFIPRSHADATELPLTADLGKLRPEAREVGTMRPRAAACVLDDGTFLVALTTFDTDEANTQALLSLGCLRVVALDRGSHHSAFVARTGADSPLEKRYDASAVYVLESPATGRASRL
jgi:hypothetical protein